MTKNIILLTLGLCLIQVSVSYADQPVMNEAPRWAGGKGFQIRHEYRASDTLISKEDEIPNPLGKKRRVDTTWLEGVYTWNRSRRITIKIPYVDKMRVTEVAGQAVKQHDRGLGDIIIGTPLRKYTNYKNWTNNFSFTPSIRIPSGKTSGDYPIGDGSTDVGLSFSYGAESPRYLAGVDFFYWINNSGRRGQHEGNLFGLDVTLGKTVYHNGKKSAGASVQLDFGLRYKEDGSTISGNGTGTRVMLGPGLVYFQGPMIARAVYTIPIYENALDETVSYGHQLDIGIGWSF
ncbi:MAG: hypothetical protein ACI9E5_000617 [Candidatus Omnitrophota bacterium]|jgi:hypothetical protein